MLGRVARVTSRGRFGTGWATTSWKPRSTALTSATLPTSRISVARVIDRRAFAKNVAAIDASQGRARCDRRGRWQIRRQRGLFRPADACCHADDPTRRALPGRSIFGPILSVLCLRRRQARSEIARAWSTPARRTRLTGAVFAEDRGRDQRRRRPAALRGRQLLHQRQADRRGRRPAAVRRRRARRAPTTRPGSTLNLLRWTSARSIKETFVPPTDYNYPHMGAR